MAMGLPTFAVYAAAKAAVRSFLRAWAVELKDRKIRVNAVSPGPIETQTLEKAGIPPEMLEQAIAGFASQVGSSEIQGIGIDGRLHRLAAESLERHMPVKRHAYREGA